MRLIDTTRALLSGGLDSKAIQRPAASEPRPAIYGPGVSSRIAQRGARSFMQGFAGDNAVDWIADAVEYWALTASGAEFHFERAGKRMRMADEEPGEGKFPGGAVPPSLEGLIRQPNPFQTYEELIWLLVADLLLVGNGYWLKYRMDEQGRPLALYRLHPAMIEAEPGERRPVDRYLYRVEGVAEPIEYRPEEIIHFKLPNPNSNIYGAGIIERAPRVYDAEMANVETQARFFEHGTKLSGVLTSDRSVPDSIFQKVQRQFASLYSGAKRAYQVAILERGLQFQSIQPTAAEAQFVELTELGRDRIFLMFGMHPVLVNAESARPHLLEEAQRNFDTKKMRPFLNRLQKIISTELTHAWDGIDFRIDYEYVMPEKDRLTLAAVFSALPGITVGEVREYVGLERLGDERDDIVLNMPGLGVEAGGTPMGAMPGLEGGRPAKPNNLSAFPNRPEARPDARFARTRGQLQKALESGDAEALERALEEAADAKAQEALVVEAPVAMTERTIAVLEKYRAASKQERAQAVAELADALPGGQRQLRGRIIAHVAEGIRRGYTADQIIDGVRDEEYDGVRRLLTPEPLRELENEQHGEEQE